MKAPGPQLCVVSAWLQASSASPGRVLRMGPALPAEAALGPVPADAQSDADQAITAIYGTEYRPLVRLAAALVGDVGIAEEVVQDSFVAMYGVWAGFGTATRRWHTYGGA